MRTYAGYELRTSGRCTSYLSSIDECNKAAAVMLPQKMTASAVADSKYPPGCVYANYDLIMNTDRSTWRQCSGFAECLCKVAMTRAPASSAPDTSHAPTTVRTLAPTTRLQPPSISKLLTRCNAMMNTSFLETNITEVAIDEIGTFMLHALFNRCHQPQDDFTDRCREMDRTQGSSEAFLPSACDVAQTPRT